MFVIEVCFWVVGQVSAVEVTAVLLPQSGDKQPENLTKWLLESLLTYSVSEVWASLVILIHIHIQVLFILLFIHLQVHIIFTF